MAAMVHFVGITFYGLFASGDLQPWAEPTEEQQAEWENAAKKPQIKDITQTETNLVYNRIYTVACLVFQDYYAYLYFVFEIQDADSSSQIISQQAASNYGAVQHVPGNPFANYVEQEQIQPPAQDTYMHGTVDDRTYQI